MINNDGTKFWTADGLNDIRLYNVSGDSFEVFGSKKDGDRIELLHIDYNQP